MDPRTFARVKVVSISMLISIILAACGGEKARDAEDPVVEVSPGLSSLESSVAPVNVVSKSVAFSSKSNIAASSSPVIAIASSKSSKDAASISPSSQASKSSVNVVSNNQASVNSAVTSAATILALSSRAASSAALSSRAASSKAASSIALSSKSASSKQAGALGATIEWRQPSARQNGDYLELSEIGGYQIRYKSSTATTFNYITIEGNSTTKYVFDKSTIGLKFEIAVYDDSGLYSDFVTIN
ncbi:MAG: hypothetical protein V4732_02505 [Pseudomonadota bacterium]